MTLDIAALAHTRPEFKRRWQRRIEWAMGLLPHQIPPNDDWFMWLLEAGRGAGKTATASNYVTDHVNGPACITDDVPHRVALIAPTLGDAIESANLTDMALTKLDPDSSFRQSGGGSMVRYPNGSQVRLFGTHTKEDVDRLRAGGNRCLVWAEELASWRHLEDAWENMMFGLRLGPSPRIIATTTPKARPPYRRVRDFATHTSHATTLDNPHLNERQRQILFEIYGDTTIGRQELYGHLIEEAEGAIWTIDLIEAGRRVDLLDRVSESDAGVNESDAGISESDAGISESDAGISESDAGINGRDAGIMDRVVVAIDPPGGATEAGIVAAGRISQDCPCGGDRYPHFAVVADRSGKLSPEGWGTRAIETFYEWGGDRVLGESNYGGDMVQSVIRMIDSNVPYKKVTATRGKRLRAEPIKALYEQQRVHHVGMFEELESEMVMWEPDVSDWSPNRLDALVWALTELAGGRRLISGDVMS